MRTLPRKVCKRIKNDIAKFRGRVFQKRERVARRNSRSAVTLAL